MSTTDTDVKQVIDFTYCKRTVEIIPQRNNWITKYQKQRKTSQNRSSENSGGNIVMQTICTDDSSEMSFKSKTWNYRTE